MIITYTINFLDVRDLICVDDLAEDEDDKYNELGPNGALVFCMEYIADNISELQDAIEGGDDEYFLFDCPGQIELYSHMNVMRTIIDSIRSFGFSIAAVFVLDSQFMIDIDKFIAGSMTALSTLMVLECSAVCVLSKMDLLKDDDRENVEHILETEFSKLLEEIPPSGFSKNHRMLTERIANIMDSYSMVSFIPLNLEDEDSIADLLLQVDNAIQYGEDLDVKDRIPEDVDPDEGTWEE